MNNYTQREDEIEERNNRCDPTRKEVKRYVRHWMGGDTVEVSRYYC